MARIWDLLNRQKAPTASDLASDPQGALARMPWQRRQQAVDPAAEAQAGINAPAYQPESPVAPAPAPDAGVNSPWGQTLGWFAGAKRRGKFRIT